MTRAFRPSIIAQRTFSLAAGRPRAHARRYTSIEAPTNQRQTLFGNRMGPGTFTAEFGKQRDAQRAAELLEIAHHTRRADTEFSREPRDRSGR